jgi:hypothetical protein
MSRRYFKSKERMDRQFRKVKQRGYCVTGRQERYICSPLQKKGCFMIIYILNYLWPVNIVSTKQLFPRFYISDPINQQPQSFLNTRFKRFPTAHLWSARFRHHYFLALIFHIQPTETVLRKGSIGLWDRDVRVCLYLFVCVTCLHNQPIHRNQTSGQGAQQRS